MTRQEILAVAKPILFNTDMVRAILEGRKTATRRVIKPQPGDFLYVRETWRPTGAISQPYAYRADENDLHLIGEDGQVLTLKYRWHPSIHMPKEAARIFLQVTEVRAERLQDITDKQIENEGIRAWSKDGKLYKYAPADSEGDAPAWPWADCPYTPKEAMERLWDTCYASPRPVKHNGIITHYESYPWEDIRETRTHKGLPWEVYGNPWLWVIEFERVIPEGEH